MANRAVVVDLLVRTNQFTTGMRRASHDMSSATTNMETKVKALQMQIGLLGVGMVAFAALAVSKWAQFDKAMSRTEATGGEAAKRINELNEAAKSDEVIELGYNAIEASDAIYELTKAGVSATDIIGGAMAGAMSLAAAETMDAAESASIMASALTQFNLKGDQSAHVADLIVAAAGKAQGSAHDLGFALKQSGLVANQFGLSIEEATGTLAFFASAGLIGSDAGTSLRTMLLHLAGPSTKAAKLMDEIGLEIYGANGQMVDMATLADNLQSSMGKLTEKQRNQALATIFGADATRAASLLYREGGDAVTEWIGKVNDAGYAQDVARKRMDNLSGDIKKLSATWDRSMINMGQTADAPMRNLVQGITDVIDWFGELEPAVQGVIMALTGGGGLIILATLGIAQIVSALGTLQAGLVATGIITQATATKMATAFGAVSKSMGLVGLAIGVLVAGYAITQDAQNDLRLSVDDLASSYDVAAGAFNDAARALVAEKLFDKMSWVQRNRSGFQSLAEAAEYLKVPLNDLTDAMLGNDEAARKVTESIGLFGNAWNYTGEANTGFKEGKEAAEELGLEYGKATSAAALLFNTIDKNQAVSAEAEEKARGLAEAQGETASASGELAGELDVLTESASAVTAAEVEARKAHEDYISAIVGSFTSFFGLGDVYQGVIDAQRALAESAAEESESTKDSWEDFYDGVSVSADQYIAELQRQVEAQEAWAANLIALTDRAKTELPANLQVAAQEMINELRDLGPEGAAQVALLKDMSATELATVVELFNRQGVAAGEEWAAGVEAAENPKVEVDTTKATTDMETLQQKLDNAAGRRVTIPFDASIQPALSKIETLKAAISSVAGKSVAIPYQSNIHGNAEGGAISGPGTGTSDSIVARLSNGEHVLTASDVAKAGGQEAVYRMRGAIQSGLLKFASGGPVINGRPADYWRSAYMDYPERLRLLAQIQGQEADLGKRGKDAVKGMDRQVLIVDLSENRRKLDEASFAASLGSQDYWDSMIEAHRAEEQRLGNLADARADYSTAINRGEFKEDLTNGMSGAVSALDRIRKDVLPNLQGGQQHALAVALNAAETAARGLYSQIDAIDESMKSAVEQADELRGISDSVKNNLSGGFDLGDLQTPSTAVVNPFTGEITGGAGTSGQTMLKSAQRYAGKVQTFAAKLKGLADKGFSGVILQQIAAMGVEAGIPAADALLSLSTVETSALNEAYRDIERWSADAGQYVTEGFYKGGLAAADGLVAGLKAQEDQIQAAITDMANSMVDALRRALGIASPARRIRAEMKFVGQGAALGLDDQRGIVADASARLFSGVTVPGHGGFYGSYGSGSGSEGAITAALTDDQIERLAVAFETGNVRNINAATAQKNLKMQRTYGAKGR